MWQFRLMLHNEPINALSNQKNPWYPAELIRDFQSSISAGYPVACKINTVFHYRTTTLLLFFFVGSKCQTCYNHKPERIQNNCYIIIFLWARNDKCVSWNCFNRHNSAWINQKGYRATVQRFFPWVKILNVLYKQEAFRHI